MIRKDYIQKIIEEFAKALATIMGLKEDGEYGKALDKIDEAYVGTMDVDPKILRSIDESELVEFLQIEKQFDNQYLKMIAELLFEEGQVYVETGDPVSARNVLGKAKKLIEYLMENDATFSFNWYDKIAFIDQVFEH